LEETFPGKVRQDAFSENPQQDIGNSMEPRLYQGQALRVCAVRTVLTEPSLHAPPEGGKGDGAAGAHPPHFRRGSGSGANFQKATHKFCGRGENEIPEINLDSLHLPGFLFGQHAIEEYSQVSRDYENVRKFLSINWERGQDNHTHGLQIGRWVLN